MDQLSPHSSRVSPVILSPRSAPYSELGHSQSNISRTHQVDNVDQFTLKQARWSQHRKKIGLPRLSNKQTTNIPSEDQRRFNFFCKEHFKRKECIKFVHKKDSKTNKIKCHCGEEPQYHTDCQRIPGVSEHFQKGIIASSKLLNSGTTKKMKSSQNKAEAEMPDNEWSAAKHIQKFHTNAYGKIDFISEGLGGKKPAKYVRLSDDTPIDPVVTLITEHWHMMKPEKPSLVITVIGGAKNFKLDGKKREVFNRGLVKAAHTTHAWLITSGFNMGVMKAVGEAVQEGQSYNWDNFGMTHSLRCIGIAPWGYVENRNCLVGEEGLYNASYKVNNVIRHYHPVPLNHNHTHLLLVDDGYRNRYGGVAEFRASLERKIAQPVKPIDEGQEPGLGIPVVLVVVEGGTDAIKDARKSLHQKTPVVLCEGTGRAADIMAYAFKHRITTRNDNRKEQHILVMEDMLLEAYGKTWSERSDIKVELKKYKDMVLECCKDEKLITVFDMNKGEELDLAILSALLKGQGASNVDQLKLSLTWNRSDIAEDKIFRDDVVWPTEDLYDIMTNALRDNKVDFVRLLLQHGVIMKEYLTVKRLRTLYNEAPKTSHLKQQLNKKINESRQFCLNDIDLLLKKHMGKFSNSIYQADTNAEFSISSFGQPPEFKTKDSNTFPAPFRELFFWAVLLNRQDMAKFLWERGEEAIPSAIAASKIYGSLADIVNHADLDLKLSYSNHKDEFEKLAVKVLDECNEADPDKASILIERKYNTWGDLNCMEMAAAAGDKMFLSTVCCQNSLNLTWKRGILSSSYKVMLGLLFPPFVLSSIKFHNLGDEVKQMNPLQKLLTFYRAPVTKFFGHTLLYLVFLTLYSCMILFDFRYNVTISEWIVICWIGTLFLEEIREMFSSKADSPLHKLIDYWNFSMFNRLDIVMILMALLGFGLRMGSYINRDLFIPAKTLYSLNCVLFFLRLLRLYSANSNLGPKLVMIKLMLYELMQYITIMIVFVLGYGIACQSIMFPIREAQWSILKDIFYYPYWQIYGEVFLEEMEGRTDDCTGNSSVMNDGSPCPMYSPLVPFLTAVYLLIGNILLVNLLIAIFTHIFEEVQTNSVEVWKYEMYFLVVEYDTKPGLAPPFIIFEHIYLLVRWIFRRSCFNNDKKGLDLISRYEHQLRVFEQEAVSSLQRRNVAKSKQDVSLKINQIQFRVDDMANLIEEERRLEQQHFEAQLNRTAPEGAENNVLASPPSSSRRRASFSSPFMPGIVVSPRSRKSSSAMLAPNQIEPPPITISHVTDENKFSRWPSLERLRPLIKKQRTSRKLQPSNLMDIVEVQSERSDLSLSSPAHSRPAVGIGQEAVYPAPGSDNNPAYNVPPGVLRTDGTSSDHVSCSSRPNTSSTGRTDEPWKPPAPTRNTAPPGREAGHHDSDQLNWSTDNFTNRSSPEPLFKKRVHTFRREDSWGMRRTDTVESFDTYRMSPIETPLSDFVDRYNRERSRSPSVHSEKMAEMDTRLSELEENTKRSLYNIETLLRNAVFSRASTSVNRRHSRARDRHRDRDSVM